MQNKVRLVLGCAALFCAGAVLADDVARMDRGKLQIGAYCLAPYARTAMHVKDLADCGIDFIYGIPATDRATLDLCAKYGVGVIATGAVPFWHGMGGEKAGQMRALRPYATYEKALADYDDHPAIWMLDYVDEPSALDFAYIGDVTRLMQSEMPKGIIPYINLYPNYASVVGNTSKQTVNQLGTRTYREHVEAYVKDVPVDYLCFDFYLYSARGEARAKKLEAFYENFEDAAAVCRKTGKSLWYIPQVNSSYPELWLSVNMLRFQAYLALAYGAEQIDWACWSRVAADETHDMPGLHGWWTNNVLTLTGEKTEQYAKLKAVNAELHAMGPRYMAYRTIGTRRIGGNKDAFVVGDMVARDGSGHRAMFVLAAGDPFDEHPAAQRFVFNAKMAKAYGPASELVVTREANGAFSITLPSNAAALITYDPADDVWISVPDQAVHRSNDDRLRAADGTSWFATVFTNAADVVKAEWTVAGLGVFEAFVNGQHVGNDFLIPGFTNNGTTKNAFSYDVTDLIGKKTGDVNALAAEVSTGWWRDSIVHFYGKKSAFRATLVLTCKDGTTRRIATNVRDWRCGVAGAVTHAGIYDGEEYDARIVQPVCGEGLYAIPEENVEFKGVILPVAGAKVTRRHDLTRKPVRAYAWRGVTGESNDAFGKVKIVREFTPAGPYALKMGETLVLDFGQNAAAIPVFRFAAKRDTVLTARPAEMLNDANGAKSRGNDGPEGSVYRVNLREGYEKGRLVRYTFSGGKAEYSPRFTFFGYRYLSVSATDDVIIESLTMVPVTSIAANDETGTLETGDAAVNRLIANAWWGMLSNYLSVPTDCPQRDERVGWTADTQVFTETASYFADVRAFHHKWMRDVRDCQGPKGSFTSVAPFGRYGSSQMRLGWADAGIIVPYHIWRQFGDCAIVDENWAAMAKYAAHVRETKYRQSEIADECHGYQYADWLSFEKYESHGGLYKQQKQEAMRYWDYLGACYGLMDARMMIEMAHGTGRDAAPYEAMADELKTYLKQTFFASADGLIDAPYRDMQTPALFALKLGLVEGAAKEQTLKGLLDNFAAHKGSLQTGFLGTSIIMDTLTEAGRPDAAYALLLNHNFPGWLYSVDQGATTIWERWNSYTKEKGFGPVGMNSFNHYAYGSVVAWIYKHAAGITTDSAKPGYRHIILAPKPDRRLGYVKASYRSAAGMITSYWRYEGAQWRWTFTIPEGVTAAVTIPGDCVSREYSSGTYTVER